MNANDTALLVENEKKLQWNLYLLNEEGIKINMRTNTFKGKIYWSSKINRNQTVIPRDPRIRLLTIRKKTLHRKSQMQNVLHKTPYFGPR